MTVTGVNAAPQPSTRTVVDKSNELYKACLDFEALFIKQMLNAMRQTVDEAGLLEGGIGADYWKDMLYDEYAKRMAETGQFGLAETMYIQINNQK